MTAEKKARKSRKNSGENSGPRLVEQGHGGALLSGGVRGNKGGSGRPPSAIREDARLAFAELLPAFKAIARGEVVEKVLIDGKETEMTKSARVSDRIKAWDLLGRYGAVAEIALTAEEQPEPVVTPEWLAEQWERIQRVKSIEELEELVTAAAREQAAANA